MKKISIAARAAACFAAVCMAIGAYPADGYIGGAPLFGVTAGAEEVICSGISGDTEWTLDDSGILTFSGNGSTEDYASTSTPFYGSQYGVQIKRAVILSGVTAVGDYVLYGLRNMTSAVIPSTVTRIGDGAFTFCTSLRDITLSNGVRSIGSAAFSSTGIAYLELPDSVTNIDQYAVTACENLRSVVLPAGLVSVGKGAFSYNDQLTDIYFRGTRSEWYELFSQYGKVTDTQILEYLGLSTSARVYFEYPESGEQPYFPGYITGSGVSVSADKVSPSAVFSVYFDIPASIYNADTVSFRASFDPSVFEVVSWYSNDPADSRYVGDVIAGGMANHGNGFLSLSATNAAHSIDLSRGIRLSAEMMVKSTAVSGSHYIEIIKNSISYVTEGGRESVEIWDPVTKRVKIDVITNNISGRVTGYGDNKGSVTVQLTDSTGQVIDTVVTSDGTYAFNKVTPGKTYTVRASMPRCVPRDYTVTASTSPVANDMVIYRLGDVNGDTFVDSKDATQILRYDAGLPSLIRDASGRLNEYLFSVARVLGNSTLTPKDATQIMRYEAGYPSVFDNMS